MGTAFSSSNASLRLEACSDRHHPWLQVFKSRAAVNTTICERFRLVRGSHTVEVDPKPDLPWALVSPFSPSAMLAGYCCPALNSVDMLVFPGGGGADPFST
ncbi:hypothetical protein HYQ44_019103 [Verticillium longisporum]|nr:hypothetical protein HYQ44_019103 [Verticillium longisporum]